MINTHFQDYVNFLTAAGSRAEEVVDVPKEYPNYLRAGAEYAQLLTVLGYKRLLDDMEKRGDRALAALRQCESTDPVIIKGLRDRWREAEESLKFIQVTVGEAIERRKAIIEDLGMRMGIGASGLDIDDSADQQAIKDFMGGGFVSIDDDDMIANQRQEQGQQQRETVTMSNPQGEYGQ